MYHYVRNNENYNYDTFCRRKNEFEAQIEFFRKSGEIVDPSDIQKIKYFLKKDNQKAYLLTFDDGYKDHLYCAKYLYDRNHKAYFFPPINALNGDLLDVNAIHMIIGLRGLEIKSILEIVAEECMSSNYLLTFKNQTINISSYFDLFDEKNEHDNRDTLMFRRILQRDLIGEKNKRSVIDKLLDKFLDKKSSDIASELYLNNQDLINMKKMGMLFGSHGMHHKWLNTLNFDKQKIEIENSIISLHNMSLISINEPKTVCYPFGAYDLNTIMIMNKLNLDFGFTTEIGSAKFKDGKNFMYTLPRWDTNHFWDKKWRRPCKVY